jgi:hypothetical protein
MPLVKIRAKHILLLWQNCAESCSNDRFCNYSLAKYANAAALNPTKSIVCIGRFSANKRLDLAIKFAAALHRYDREWT